MRWWLVVALFSIIGWGCASCHGEMGGLGSWAGAPGDGDADSDSDGDADSDADADGDADSDSDADAHVEGDAEVDGGSDPVVDADPPPPSSPITVGVIADLNGSYGSTTYSGDVHDAVARLVELRPDLVISLGDMVAGQQSGLDYRAMWSSFHEAVSDPLARAGIPLAVTPGNHDASGYSSFSGERAIFITEWEARRPAVEFVDDERYPLRYAFVMGSALFISLDATTVGHLNREQMVWLEAQLEAGRGLRPKVVFGHLPIYPVSEGRETEIIGDPELEVLLVEHEVDLLLAGHHHAYYPGRRGRLRLATAACLGGGPRPLLGQEGNSPRSLMVLTLTPEGELQLDAFGGEGFLIPVLRGALPERVGSGDMLVRRDDL